MENDFSSLREKMVESQIAARGVRRRSVLEAMRKVARDEFVPVNMQPYAYADEPLPIGSGQTISQPYIVAYMTDRLDLRKTDRVLEIGTGSGYQTAILAETAADVWTVEIVAALSKRARAVLAAMGYTNIRFKVGDGTLGWEEGQPYNAIMVTAAPPAVPQELRNQLRDGGRMILPVGVDYQELVLVRRRGETFDEARLLPVRFVPLVSTH